MIRLDIGCGDQSSKMEEVDAEYIGLDIDRGPKGFHPDVVADANALPFKDGSIDDVWSGACIGLYVDKKGFDEALRVLKPGGRFRIRIYTKYLPRVLKWFLDEKVIIMDFESLNYSEYGDSYYGFYDKDKYPADDSDNKIEVVDDVIITTRKRSDTHDA